MRNIKTDPSLKLIEDAVIKYALEKYNRNLPEIRFFILDANEFMCLLEKGVYPKSPPNLWEGQDIVKRKQRVEAGLESSIYYEVVQTGNPSYAYLNDGNSATTQASVMAHVVGHCEFEVLNVLGVSEDHRSEFAMFLSRKVEYARERMGHNNYFNFWNACHSMLPFVNPNSRWNLESTVETDSNILLGEQTVVKETNDAFVPFSSTIDSMFNQKDPDKVMKDFERRKDDNESISRKGYKLKLPCQDIFGFLTHHAPLSDSEKEIMEYLYFIHRHYDFVRRTQIMNEGWAMYWEKTIMMDLFKDGVCTDIVDYAHKFSGVLYPRPFFQRNPYHLGYNMWHAIKKEYEEGKITSEYRNELDSHTKDSWDKKPQKDSLKFMEEIVGTCTDYEFLRRFLTKDRIGDFHLNRIPNRMGLQLNPQEIINKDQNFTWIEENICREYMLNWFTDYYQPRVYIVNTDFNNGGLLMFHRHAGKNLKESWIKPTLKNISRIWHADTYIMSGEVLYSLKGNKFEATQTTQYTFEQIVDIMKEGKKVTL